MEKILIIEDEEKIARFIELELQQFILKEWEYHPVKNRADNTLFISGWVPILVGLLILDSIWRKQPQQIYRICACNPWFSFLKPR